MKNIFKAIARKISSTEEFKFKDGSRTAVVEAKHFLFAKSVKCTLSDGKGNTGGYTKSGTIPKDTVEKAKETAQNFCWTGTMATPKW